MFGHSPNLCPNILSKLRPHLLILQWGLASYVWAMPKQFEFATFLVSFFLFFKLYSKLLFLPDSNRLQILEKDPEVFRFYATANLYSLHY